ncbi:hypothetical protein MKY34_10600 [Sporosarcina sp. FSL K6-1522]|uniref:hypothetical protein n=1 Tax=Sporosarcina sp. FSL K6-1522 TaxID=2921554 RepID=UPI00315B339D
MKKVILWIVGSAIVVLLCVVVLVTLTGFWIVKEAKNYTGHSNDDLIAYVEEKYDVPIEVISNDGRIPSSFGGLKMSDAYVRTLDENRISFDIQIDVFGHISGDNYEKQKQRFDLNNESGNLLVLKEIKDFGFQNLSFGDSENDPEIRMDLPGNLTFQDQATFDLIYRALPELQELQKEVSKRKYRIESVVIGGVLLNINQTYTNAEHLRNKLASSNVEVFSYYLFEEDFGLLKPLLPLMEEQGFSTDRDMNYTFSCYEMIVHDRCEAYSFTLYTYGRMESGFQSEFRYDRLEDKEKLFKVIQEIQNTHLPIKQVMVDNLYVPQSSEDQHITEEELRERENSVHFIRTTVEVSTNKKLRTLDDLQFVY